MIATKKFMNLSDRRSLPAPRSGYNHPLDQLTTLLVSWFPFMKEGLKRAREELNPKLS
jgi:hypothetical protein